MMTLMPRSIRAPARRPPARRNPYENFRDRELTLADYLAIDRTILANERTALAYGRTALAMIIIGGTALKFFAQWYMWAIGAVFIAAAIIVAAIGARRYHRTARYLAVALERQTGDPGHPLRGTPEAKTRPEPAKPREPEEPARAGESQESKAPAGPA
jgi:putative membrane protein